MQKKNKQESRTKDGLKKKQIPSSYAQKLLLVYKKNLKVFFVFLKEGMTLFIIEIL